MIPHLNSYITPRDGIRITAYTRSLQLARYEATEFSSTFRAGPALVAQGIEHRFPKPCVAGSNPAGGTAKVLLDRLLLDAPTDGGGPW